MSATTLGGASVVVAGAGLAGLSAARDLVALGADVTVVDARDRVGGRVWTIRDGFAERQHAEAGGDMIDEAQHEIRELAGELGLKLTRILRGGFGYVRADRSGKAKIVQRDASRGWERLAEALDDWARPYRLAEQRWDSPIAARPRAPIRRLVARRASRPTTSCAPPRPACAGSSWPTPRNCRCIALVDQFAADDGPALQSMYRIDGGNDRLAAALAAPLGDRLHLNTEVVAVSHRGQNVRVSVKNGRAVSQIGCDYAVFAAAGHPAPAHSDHARRCPRSSTTRSPT